MLLPSFHTDGAEPAAMGETRECGSWVHVDANNHVNFTHSKSGNTMPPKEKVPKIAARSVCDIRARHQFRAITRSYIL